MMDLYADFLQRNKLEGQIILVWGNKDNTPEWLLKGNFSENELLEFLENHIVTVMSRYKGKIQEYSVVNEILGHPWDKENSFWYDHLNKNLDWVRKCFEWAYRADPNAILILNDFGIEMPGTRVYWEDRNEFNYNLARDMKDSGVPINGVALQLHEYGLDFYPETRIPELMEKFDKNIRKYQDLGVDVYITEFDLRLGGLKGTKDEKYALQAKVYGSILDTCLNAGIKSFTLFNLIDRLSWLESPENPPHTGKDADPCAWDDNYQPKPAYFAMMDVMKKHYQQRNS
jgi:endo-1,4-beta-xylanase